MLSFWERRSYLQYDYAVVGGGIVGLSTAAHLLEKEPHARVVVLERGLFPSGASTKNAGFACFGSLTELLSDLNTLGEDRMLALVEERYSGLKRLRERLGDSVIDYQNHGGYELIREPEEAALEQMDYINDLLKPLFPKPVFHPANEKIKEFGFHTPDLKGMVFNPYEGQIDTGKMMKALTRYVTHLGAVILTGSEVSHWEEMADQVVLGVENPVYEEPTLLHARRMVICTNAFSQQLLPEINLKPGRGVVLVTEPIPDLSFQGTFHYDEGYYYFRNFGRQVIFGGGRNLDIEVETSTEFIINERIRSVLEEHLREFILPGKQVEIADWWTGIMAFGDHKEPLFQPHSDKVLVAVRLGGMGVAIGSRLGDRAANWLLSPSLEMA
ncbi:MAG TPA: FAD-dependent oxidoreductase [Cytophagales bacterium]|nr:FAD-dependent oxidoreductase [Cytophagales bacterium]HAA20974.1 FAD-dependent oxidoreductase [Cytophagales bacterium]HAP62613.1 FAD-dependent oxidoreductase [Cytophagales bacterium]